MYIYMYAELAEIEGKFDIFTKSLYTYNVSRERVLRKRLVGIDSMKFKDKCLIT